MAKKISFTPQSQQQSPEPRHETRDISLKLIAFVLALIFFSGFVIHGTIWAWLVFLPQGTHQKFASYWRVLSPKAAAEGEPALQVSPKKDLREVQLEQEHRISSYGWIDPQAGIIQVPVARAIQLIAQQHGLPQWQPTAARFDLPASEDPASADIDSALLKKMAQDSLGTIQLGRAGARKASSSQLADAGKKLQHEHEKFLHQIRSVARSTGVSLPDTMGLKDRLVLQQLQQEHGDEFDRKLARQFLEDNALALAELDDATNKLQKPAVKGLAAHLNDKLETETQDIRDAAKDAGIAEGTIEAIIEREKEAAQGSEFGELQRHQKGPERQSQMENAAPETQSGTPHEHPPPPSGGDPPARETDSKDPDSRGSATDASSSVDAAFLRRLAQSSFADWQLGRLGSKCATNPQLSQLSRDLVQEHTQLKPKLDSAAAALGIVLPKEAGLEEQLAWNALRREHGQQLERELASRMLAVEAGLLQEVENATNDLKHPQVRQLSREVIAGLVERLGQAKQAAKAVGLTPRRREQIVVRAVLAAGAPYPLMAGAELGSTSGKKAQPKPPKGQGSATSPGGRQTQTQVSPLQLQQERAHRATPGNTQD